MIPVSLTIKGLYSYQKEQHIDFSKLMEGQLFGIFGTVGSGKSSILEAISYALYGDTERMNRNDNRSYNMMNLKSNELLIDFIFDNYDNIRYRFVVRGKRNSRNFDKVGTLDRNAYKFFNGTWEPLESASGEEIIGLSYENFRRTIIIPQGKFQEFLQLGDRDRTNMLKDIFQLEKYEFFYQTTALEKTNQEAIHLLNGELAVYASVSEELILENERKILEIKNVFTELQLKLELKERLFKEQEQVKQWHIELLNCEQILEGLAAKSVFYTELRRRIQDFEYCFIHFRELINKTDRSKTEIVKLEEVIRQYTVELEQNIKRLVEGETELSKWKKEFDLKDVYRSKLEDYQVILKVLDAEEELVKITDRIPAGEKYVKEVANIRTALNEQLIDKKKELKAKKLALPDLNILSDIRNWFAGYKHENELLQKEQTALETKTAELKALDAKIESVTKSELLSDHKIESLPDAQEAIQHCFFALHKEEAEHRDLLTNYQVQIKLGEFSSTLHDGEACLLCGSLEHPKILVAHDVQEHLDLCEQKLKEILQKNKSLNDLAQQIAVITHQKNDLELQHQKLKEQLLEINNRVLALKNNFHWEGFSPADEAMVLEKFNDARQLGVAIRSLEQEEEKIQSQIVEADEKYNKYKEGLEQLHKQGAQKQAEIDTLKQQIKKSDSNLLFKESKEVITDKLNDLKAFISEIESGYDRSLARVNTEQQNKILLQERLTTSNNRLREEVADLQIIQSQIDQEINNSAYQSVEQVIAILADPINLAQEKQDLQNYEQQLYTLKESQNKIKAQLADQVFVPEVYETLMREIIVLKEEVKTANSELIKTEAVFIQQKNDYQRKLNLEKQLARLITRSENINTLKNLFKGSGFVSYISSVYLNQLCAAANERFYKLSRQQLRLEVTDKNDFQVRDYLNDGHVRSVKTLSGGQTFQASLALALALAESVQQQNKSMQNFFFLDEGFGSLDKESLQIAFDTLKSLRKENRIVGVISHVEELQQEIDVFLNVSNSSAEGSMVKGSWE